MTSSNFQRLRLYSQHLAGPPFNKPEDVVQWLGAIQAQDYAAAKWAVAQRTAGGTDAALDQALADGTILRTHVLRPTWHFVSPADIRWMLELTAPRVNALSAYYYRKTGLTEKVFAKSNAALTEALQGGRQLTRAELGSVLQKARISKASDDPIRLVYLIMRAELDMIICSGARRGKQFTYALLDERAPKTPRFSRRESLGELVRRFFTSRGPATIREFTRWSSLSHADAKAGIELVEAHLRRLKIDGEVYWLGPELPAMSQSPPRALLLPAYDEYLLAYKTHGDVMLGLSAEQLKHVSSVAARTILLDGRIIGTWKRHYTKDAVDIVPFYFVQVTPAKKRAIAAAVERYGRFAGLHARLRDS